MSQKSQPTNDDPEDEYLPVGFFEDQDGCKALSGWRLIVSAGCK